jgi:hypothetical protein
VEITATEPWYLEGQLVPRSAAYSSIRGDSSWSNSISQ